jgi:hypothetical protein
VKSRGFFNLAIQIQQRLIDKLYSSKNSMMAREGKMKGENEKVSLVNPSFLKKGLGIVAIALIAAIMVMPGMAQTPPEEEWNSIFGGAALDEGYSVNPAKDGGYIIAGYTSCTDNILMI